jgi:hypothetical protein
MKAGALRDHLIVFDDLDAAVTEIERRGPAVG